MKFVLWNNVNERYTSFQRKWKAKVVFGCKLINKRGSICLSVTHFWAEATGWTESSMQAVTKQWMKSFAYTNLFYLCISTLHEGMSISWSVCSSILRWEETIHNLFQVFRPDNFLMHNRTNCFCLPWNLIPHTSANDVTQNSKSVLFTKFPPHQLFLLHHIWYRIKTLFFRFKLKEFIQQYVFLSLSVHLFSLFLSSTDS